MAEAISTGTCSGIIVANGAACVSDGYVPPEIDGSDNDDIDNGPANDPFKNQ
jgi:hypothetical protein